MERVNKINAAWVVAFVAMAAIAVALGIVFGDKKSHTTSTSTKPESSTTPPVADALPPIPPRGYSTDREDETLSDVAMNGGLTCDSTCTGCQAGGPWKSLGCMENVSPTSCKAWETELPNSWKLCDGSPPPPPPNPEAPKNCVLTEYGDWGPCDKACGEGTQTRTRTIIRKAKNGGKACPDTLVETRSCTGTSCPTAAVPVDCVLSDWTPGTCNVDCGTGTITKNRTIITQPAFGGKACGPLTETEPCTKPACKSTDKKTDCTVSSWSDWGRCNVDCGDGTETRTRTITQPMKNGGTSCPVLTQTRSCTGTSCPTQAPTACEVSDWNKLGACSKTCGDGTVQWTRSIIKPGIGSGPGSTCPRLTETHSCNLGPCPTATTTPTPSHSTKDPRCGSCSTCKGIGAWSAQCLDIPEVQCAYSPTQYVWCGAPTTDSGGGGAQPQPTTCASGKVNVGGTCETIIPKWQPISPSGCPDCGTMTIKSICVDQNGSSISPTNCTGTKPADIVCPSKPACKFKPLPTNMLGMYYFVNNCPEYATNIPDGMMKSANTIYVSFIDGGTFEEDKLPCGVMEAARTIKKMNSNMPVMYSIGGEEGSKSQSLYNYLKNTPIQNIVNAISKWKYADGIDWDLEPPSGGVAAKYGQGTMPKKLASISTKVKALGMNVSFAGMGVWMWDTNMGPLYNALIPVVDKCGVMYYPSEASDAATAIGYFTSQWLVGCKVCGSNPVAKASLSNLAGGINGKATATQAKLIAEAYKKAGVSNVIVWGIQPNNCGRTKLISDAADNSALGIGLPSSPQSVQAVSGER